MNLLRTNRATDKPEEHASSDDLRTLFTEEMSSLYLLSLLLTRDHDKAEQCFIGGIEDSVHGNPVSRERASSWVRRMIVENAIRIIAPLPNQASATAFAVQLEPNSELQTMRDKDDILSSVFDLADFERFAFVMSVLERYPDQDCSVLLGCTPREIRDARRRALQQIAQSYAENAVTSRAR